jgi:hypothetical protein
LILHFPALDYVAVCLEERLPVLSFFWGDPTPYVGRAHAAGVKVIHQLGSVAEAERAAAAGIDVIVAQGVEAGGHVAGEVSTLALVPRVVDALAPVPVVAAGGIADARGVVAFLALNSAAIPEHGFPLLDLPGLLVVKDSIMMGAALVTLADSAKAYLRKRKAAVRSALGRELPLVSAVR